MVVFFKYTHDFMRLLFIISCLSIASSMVHAEKVYVKYQGNVDLSSFQCDTPQSSFVHRICYQA